MAMTAFADGLVEMDGVFEDIMGFCLQCRACEAVCPSLVPFGRAMEGTRAEITIQRPARSRRVRHWLLSTVLSMRWLVRLVTLGVAVAQRLGLSRLRRGPVARLQGLRRLPLRVPSTIGRRFSPATEQRGTVALLAGCVMDPWFGEVQQATIGVLRFAGYEVFVPKGQTCCGALAAHDGAASGATRLAERNVAAFTSADVVVTNSAGCGAHLKEYGHWAVGGAELAGRVVDVTEIVADMIADESLPLLPSTDVRVAMQDPCHLRHAQRIVSEPRAIIRAAGYTPLEIDDTALCCGAAGIYSILRPKASLDLGQRKAEQVRSSDATLVASANPGCEMQLRSYLGNKYQIKHPVELYWDALQRSGDEL